jgi:hypothetical protein
MKSSQISTWNSQKRRLRAIARTNLNRREDEGLEHDSATVFSFGGERECGGEHRKVKGREEIVGALTSPSEGEEGETRGDREKQREIQEKRERE